MDKLCVYPWNTISIGCSGHQRVCCNYTIENGFSVTGNITPDKITDPKHDLKNSPYLHEIRQHMLENKWHPGCYRCKAMEEKKIRSFRQQINKSYPEVYDKILNEQKNEFLNVNYLQLDFSNKCNAVCVMCGPHSSSLWAKHEFKSPEVITWDKQIDLVLEDIDNVKVIHVFGGEPLIQNEFIYFCEKLVEKGVASKIKLIFTTNASMLHKRDLLNLFKNFKEVQVSISIDGMEKLYDYIRWPLLWNNVKSSINTFLNTTKNSNIDHSFSITLQTINIFNLIDLFKNFESIFNVNKNEKISLVEVYNPNHLSLRYSSFNYINLCLEEISKHPTNSYLTLLENRLKNEQKNIEEPWKYKSEFISYIERMNQMRSLNFYDIFDSNKLWV